MLWEYYLCSCVDAILEKDFADYPSLSFLKKGRFPASFEKTKVKKIRLYNTSNLHLHLRGVELYDDGKRIEEDALPVFTVSHGNYYKNQNYEFRFNAIVEPYMFHTANDQSENWIEIEFADPI
ncbi:MAG: hypothetical protein J5855_06200, partial [Mailhella sp.]|nr:hypothetical protein [Mailhella sp.]